MKRNLIFGGIGCVLLIGAAIFRVIKSFKKYSVNKCNKEITKEKDLMYVSPEHITEENKIDLDEIKMQTANSIYDRHKAAAQIIKESMKKVNENVDLPSEHEEELDGMLEELDMLSEGK